MVRESNQHKMPDSRKIKLNLQQACAKREKAYREQYQEELNATQKQFNQMEALEKSPGADNFPIGVAR